MNKPLQEKIKSKIQKQDQLLANIKLNSIKYENFSCQVNESVITGEINAMQFISCLESSIKESSLFFKYSKLENTSMSF